MNKKDMLRKVIYAILFILIIVAFVYIGEKYTKEDKIETVISDLYDGIDDKNFKIVRGKQTIDLLKKGHNIILMGDKTSKYSKKYIEEVSSILKELKIDNIYYYDLINDKAQENSNYYKIIELLEGNLISTDLNENILLTPSLYIVNNGKVEYYNTYTAAPKNTDELKNYWAKEKEEEFKKEVKDAIKKFYLNK